MDEIQKKFLNALNVALCQNPEGVIKILSVYSLPEEAFKISQIKLEKLGFKKETILRFLKRKDNIDIEKEWQKLKKENIRLISIEDEEYPNLLKEIIKPPALLYVKGKLLVDEKYFASVGTRWPSDYGKMVTSDLVGDLAQNGFTIVSGMARGIDSLSHRAALLRKKRTIAIVGTGLDIVFPPENKKLAKEIVKEGAIISEFPLETPALPYNFPLRNRIIAGMSLGVLVIEGRKKSGALITANLAIEEGREVFATPGPIYSKTSAAPNNLIKQGAHPLTDVNDILAAFDLKGTIEKERKIKGETEEENLILKILEERPASIDQIIKETKLDTAKVNSALILMEIKGKVKKSGNKYHITSH